MTDETAPQPPVRKGRRYRPKSALGWFLAAMVSLVMLVAIIGVGARYIVLSPQAMLFIEARTSGLKLGPVGELKIEGLSGDIWRDFSIARLTIADEKGVWLEAHKLRVKWTYTELFRRRLVAQSVAAEDLKVFRRPILTPKKKDSELPLSFDIDSITTRLETYPEATIERGVFNVSANLDIVRHGATQGQVKLDSLLHAGDGLHASFRVGGGLPLNIEADATEAQGGALAGAAGLSADQPLTVRAKIGGEGKGGVIDVLVRSGEDSPLLVSGGWGDAGLKAQGHADLTASRLTAELAKMFGPELTFDATGSKATADAYAFNLSADAENLKLAIAGPVNAKEKSTAGLTVRASVGDMSRITPEPKLGATAFDGKLSGTPADFRLAGNVRADGFELLDYRLARAEGPVELRLAKRELTIKSDLRGTGGAGDGIIAGLMGATPRVSSQVSRLSTGEILIRDLDGVGSGFEVHAKGSRTPIIGTLNFDGDMTATNLTPLHAGATGQLQASWSANKGRGPWAFTADARGTDFKTGMAQLDRLLGDTPRLDARAELDDGVWRITRANLNGKAGDASAVGTYGPDSALGLDLTWKANGPFQAGPVEIAGKIEGDGKLTGSLTEPRADLNAAIDGVDIGPLALENARLNLIFAKAANDSNGSVRLTADSPSGPAHASAAFRFPENGVDLSGIDAAAGGVTAKGDLALRNNQPSRADLTITVAKGVFLADGQAQATVKVVDAAGGPQADIALEGTGLQFAGNPLVIGKVDLTAKGPLSRMPYVLKAEATRGEMPFSLDGSGVASNATQGWNVTFGGKGKVQKVEVATVDPISVNFGGPVLSAQGVLSVGGGRAAIQARQDDEAVNVQADLTGVELSLVSPDLDGSFDAKLAASGRGSNLSGTLQANLQNMRSIDGPTDSAVDGVLNASLSGNRLTLDARATNEVGLASHVNLVLPAEASAAPFRIAINRTRPMQGEFDVDGELQPLWDLFFGGARTLGGRLQANGQLAGTLRDPQLTGEAILANGRFEDFATGLKLRNVAIVADLERTAVTVNAFNADDEQGGKLSGRGRVSLQAGGDSTFTLEANRFLLIDNDLATAQASGEVTVTRAATGKAALVGKLTIDRADILADPPTPSGVVPLDVIEINIPPERANYFNPPTSRGPSIALDVTLDAPRRVFVAGNGLDIELSLDAHVGGTTSAPLLTGEARVVRGEYEFAGKRFEFDDTGRVYLSSNPENIRLDLQAVRDDPSLTAVVKVGGTAAKPEITLTSTPTLPNDEVLSQVLFGRSAAQLSGIEAAQLAASLGALATGGGFDVIGGLRNFVGLDRLSFGGGDASGLTVSGGKYLSDDVYLELTGGGREGGAAQVEWRVRRTLSIVSRVTGDGDTRLSVRWRHDYGRPNP